MGAQDALVNLSQRLVSNASFWVPYPIVFANRLFWASTINVTEFTMVTATIVSKMTKFFTWSEVIEKKGL